MGLNVQYESFYVSYFSVQYFEVGIEVYFCFIENVSNLFGVIQGIKQWDQGLKFNFRFL